MYFKKFYLKTLVDFEDSTGMSLLTLLSSASMVSCCTFLQLGNPELSEEESCDLYIYYIKNNPDARIEMMKEAREKILGVKQEDKEKYNSSDRVELNSMSTLSDLLRKYCSQLMSLGLSYSEFWSMTTDDLYNCFNIFQTRRRNDINQSLWDSYQLALMIAGSVWGKPPKKVPQLKDESKFENEDFESMVARIEASVDNYNNNLMKGVNPNG